MRMLRNVSSGNSAQFGCAVNDAIWPICWRSSERFSTRKFNLNR
jgi:hypothetical protein